jgi:hypothetical protein
LEIEESAHIDDGDDEASGTPNRSDYIQESGRGASSRIAIVIAVALVVVKAATSGEKRIELHDECQMRGTFVQSLWEGSKSSRGTVFIL